MANKPNNPSLWSRAKSLARQKFDVYPSAYANGWAAKWYKSKGGTWRKAEYGMEVPMMAEGGKPDWLMEAQLKAQGYSGDALRQKMESMAAGGEPQNAGFQALPEFVQAKILSNMAEGGEPNNPGFRALPEYVQQKIMDNMAYGGYIPEMGYGGAAQQAAIAIAMKKAGKKPKSMKDGGEPNGEMALGQMAAVQDKMRKLLQFVKPDDNLDPWIASKLAVMDHSADAIADYMMYGPDAQEMEMEQMKNGGYTVTRSNDRKGKTHKVTGPDGTVKYFGDSKLGQHPKDPERKKAFYARHKKNLAGNPYFRAFARATWEDGGTIPAPITSPYSREYMQALSNEYDQFYAPPRYYGKDDGYDAFYSHKRKSFPTMKEDSGPGWLTTYSDGAQGFTSGDKDTPPKQRPGRKYDYVESYVRDVENDMGIPARILELMKTKEYNKYRPEYQRLSYKSGGYIGQDGKRHMSSTPTWSGNAGYEEGGELPMAQLGLFNPMFLQNLSSIPQNMYRYVRNLRLKNPATYNESTGMFDSVYDRITKDDTRNLGFSDSGLYVKDEAKKLQNTLNTGVAKDIRQGVRDFNKNFGTNLKTGLVIGKKGRDTLNEMAGATQQLGMG